MRQDFAKLYRSGYSGMPAKKLLSFLKLPLDKRSLHSSSSQRSKRNITAGSKGPASLQFIGPPLAQSGGPPAYFGRIPDYFEDCPGDVPAGVSPSAREKNSSLAYSRFTASSRALAVILSGSSSAFSSAALRAALSLPPVSSRA